MRVKLLMALLAVPVLVFGVQARHQAEKTIQAKIDSIIQVDNSQKAILLLEEMQCQEDSMKSGLLKIKSMLLQVDTVAASNTLTSTEKRVNERNKRN